MNICWREWTTIPSEKHFGHGVHYHDIRKQNRNSLVAWLEGYEWLHGNPGTVTVWCISPDGITTKDDLDEMKQRVESCIHKKDVPCGRITPYIEGHANA